MGVCGKGACMRACVVSVCVCVRERKKVCERERERAWCMCRVTGEMI